MNEEAIQAYAETKAAAALLRIAAKALEEAAGHLPLDDLNYEMLKLTTHNATQLSQLVAGRVLALRREIAPV